MAEKVSEEMDQAINWPDEIGVIAGPYDGNRKSWLARAARLAGVQYRQIKALYYGESDDPRHSVALKILSAAEQARVDGAKRNAQQVAEYLHQYAQALAARDAHSNRELIDEALAFVRAVREGDSA